MVRGCRWDVLALWGLGLLGWLGALPAAAQPLTVWPSPRAVSPDGEGRIRLEVVVVNQGLQPAWEVEVAVPLPEGVVVVASTPPALAEGVFRLPVIDPGRAGRVALVVEGGLVGAPRVTATVGGIARAAVGAAPVFAPEDPQVRAALAPGPLTDASDPEVLAFVARHGPDPQVLAAVVDGMAHTPYRGALRGARGAALGEGGNALDRASLLVAALRAAGVPARLAFGVLPEAAVEAAVARALPTPAALAQPDPRDKEALIATLGDPEWRAANLSAARAADFAALTAEDLAGRLQVDPRPGLRAAVAEHAWAQAWLDGAWVDLGGAEAAETALAVPEGRQHQVEVKVRMERYNPAFGGGVGGLGQVVLVAALPAGQLAGRPLTLRFERSGGEAGGLVFGSIEHVYAPVLALDDRVVARGEAVQELRTNFPAATTILVGAWVEVTLIGPDGVRGAPLRHAVLDRLGAAARGPGEDDLVVELGELGSTPSIGATHRTLIHVAPGPLPMRFAAGEAARATRLRREAVEGFLPALQALDDAPIESAPAALRARLDAWWDAQADHQPRSLAFRFLHALDGLTLGLGVQHVVHAWRDRPAVLFTTWRDVDGGTGLAVDLAQDPLSVVAHPGGSVDEVETFRVTRALLGKSLEGQLAAQAAPADATVISWDSFTQAAVAQGVQLRAAQPEHHLDLRRLRLPPDAQAGMRAALADGRMILYPEAPVRLGERAVVLWIELDLATGEATVRDPAGAQPTLVESAVLYAQAAYRAAAPGIPAGAIAGAAFGLVTAALDAVSVKVSGASLGAGAWGAGMCVVPASPAAVHGILKEAVSQAIKEGWKAFGAGAGAWFVGRIVACISYGIAYGAGRLLFGAALDAMDPPLPADRPLGLLVDRPFGPAHVHALALPADGPAGPLELAALEAQVLGAAAFEGEGSVWLAGPLTVALDGMEGVEVIEVSRLVVDGAIEGAADGRWRLDPDGADLDGVGSLRFEDAAVVLDGVARAGVSGVVSGALVGRLPVGGLSLDRAALGLGRGALGAATGRLAWGPGGLGFEGEGQDPVALDPLPARVEIPRGQEARIPLGLRGSGVVAVVADAPQGWQVAVGDGVLALRPPVDAPLGARAEVGVNVGPERADGRLAAARFEAVLVAGPGGVAVELAHAPLYTGPALAGALPLVFRGVVRSAAEAPVECPLALEVPAGFRALAPWEAVQLAPGERRDFMLRLVPEAELPPPGEALTVAVTACGARAAVALPMPAVAWAELSLDPPDRAVEIGAEEVRTLRIEGLGNAPEVLSLRLENPSRRVTVGALPETVEVVPGEVIELPVRLTPTAEAVPGLWLGLQFDLQRAAPDGPVVALATGRLRPTSAEAAGLLAAADRAREVGAAALEASLLGMAEQVDRLGFECRDRDLDALRTLLLNLGADLGDEVLRDLGEQARALAAALDARDCAAWAGPGDVQALGAALGVRLAERRDHDFRLFVTPGTRLVGLDEAAAFSLDVEARGAQATTLALSLEGLPGEVESPLAVGAGVLGHPLTVQPDQPGRHLVTVVARALEAPAIRRTVAVLVVALESFVAVPFVGSEPPFAVPGAWLRPYALVFNRANTPQALVAHFTVRRPDGSLLFEPEAPVPFRLPAQPGTHRLDLGRVATLGEVAGIYRLDLELRDAATGAPVPGGAATGPLRVGQPLEAQLAVDPPTLPPGEAAPTVRLAVRRPAFDLPPGVGRPEAIVDLEGNAAGPSSVAVGPDGAVYFTNFGTRRSSDDAGFVAGRSVGRVPVGGGEAVEFAQIPPSPSLIELGPDGLLYAMNVGTPERLVRVDPADGAVTTFWDFPANGCEGGGNGENILGIAIAADGTVYLSDWYDPFIFGIVYPGKRIYRLAPDLDGDGRSDGCTNLVAQGIAGPTKMALDPRTGDLLVQEDALGGLLRVSTTEPLTIEPWLSLPGIVGLWFDQAHPDHLLYVLTNPGDLYVLRTAVEQGRTVPVGDLAWVFGGLFAPIDLDRTADGDFITTAFEANRVLQVIMGAAAAPAALALSVGHPAAESFVPGSARPEAQRVEGILGWEGALQGDETEARFEVDHALEGLRPGDVAWLAGPTELSYGDAALELPPVIAPVEHLVGLRPDAVALRTGQPTTVTVTLLNPLPTPETYQLALEGLDPFIDARLPALVELPAEGQVEVSLVLTARADAELQESLVAVRVQGSLGQADVAVARVVVDRRAIQLELDPPHQTVRMGEPLNLTVRLTRPAEFDCRGGQLQVQGLAALGGRDTSRLVDWYRRPPVMEFQYNTQVSAPPGTYRLRFWITELIGCYGEGEITATVTVTHSDQLRVEADPPVQGAYIGGRAALTAVITNLGFSTHEVRLRDCCGALVQASFDPGPYRLGPGESRRVPIRYSLNGILNGRISRRLSVSDVAGAALPDETLAYLDLQPAALDLRLNGPFAVVDGALTLRPELRRATGQPDPLPATVVLEGPLALFTANPEQAVALPGRAFHAAPFALEGLAALAPGPWPVRIRAWPTAQPELAQTVEATVILPEGGLEATVTPDEAVVAVGVAAPFSWRLRHDDFSQPRAVALAVTSDPPGVHAAAPVLVELGPGERRAVLVGLSAAAPGDYAVRLTATGAGLEPVARPVRLRVLDPALGPVLEGLDAPGAEEGRPVQARVRFADPDDPVEALSFALDLDGDGRFERVQIGDPQFALVWPDDGVFPVGVRITDPAGAVAEGVFEVVVANVPPAIVGEPAEGATEGVGYVFAPQLVDPGDDFPLAVTLEGPAGAEWRDDAVRWTPDFDDARAGVADFTLRVRDDRSETTRAWRVTVAFADAAGDGFPDTCVERWGVAGHGDDDGDGRSNLEECLRGTDPRADGRPSVPVQVSPVDEIGVAAEPALVIEASFDPDGDPITYTFELFAGAVDPEVAEPLERGETDDLEWVTGPLADGAYQWRVRASDGAGASAWAGPAGFWVGLPPILDAGLEDGGLEDAGVTDAEIEDAAIEDAAIEDAAVEDAAVEDARREPPPSDGGFAPDVGPDPVGDAAPEDAALRPADLGGILQDARPGGPDGAAAGEDGVSSGCGCRADGGGSGVPLWALGLLALLGGRLRRRGARR